MKVIDLLNKIANGEKLPKKIKVYEVIYTLDENSLNYMDENNKNDWLAFIDGNELTTYEVEIIEEEDKGIEKISHFDINASKSIKELEDSVNLLNRGITTKINEIIDKLNEMEKE